MVILRNAVLLIMVWISFTGEECVVCRSADDTDNEIILQLNHFRRKYVL